MTLTILLLAKWFFNGWETIGIMAISTVCIYITIVVYTRLNGLRTFTKMNSFDFAVTIAIGSLLASTMISSSTSIVQGVLSIGLLILLQRIVAAWRKRSDAFEEVITNTPVKLMDGTEILWDDLTKENVTEDDLYAKLREANVIRMSDVLAVVLETTGDISVLHKSYPDDELEDCLLTGVG